MVSGTSASPLPRAFRQVRLAVEESTIFPPGGRNTLRPLRSPSCPPGLWAPEAALAKHRPRAVPPPPPGGPEPQPSERWGLAEDPHPLRTPLPRISCQPLRRPRARSPHRGPRYPRRGREPPIDPHRPEPPRGKGGDRRSARTRARMTNCHPRPSKALANSLTLDRSSGRFPRERNQLRRSDATGRPAFGTGPLASCPRARNLTFIRESPRCRWKPSGRRSCSGAREVATCPPTRRRSW